MKRSTATKTNKNEKKSDKKRERSRKVRSITKHNITQLNIDKTYSYTRKYKKMKTTTKKMEIENQHTANNK